ncbi:salicylate 1-monooxygenase, partial [Micromonospora aurantiaca]|nr:salicylate 1-monooxygenase [Micromonospora aurantiaca]
DLASSCGRLYGEETYTAHRADLLAALHTQVPAESIELGRKCVDVTRSGDVFRLRFADGRTADADVVIG